MSIRAVPQHLTILGALALALCLLVLLSVAGSGQANAAEENYRTGQVIVKLDSNITSIVDLLNRYDGAERLDDLGEDLPDNLESMDIYLLRAPDNDAFSFVSRLLAESPNNGVVYAEPNFIAETVEDPADPTYGDGRMRARSISSSKQSSDANDTFATNLNLSSCADATKDIKGATVAVLDTGAQLNHPRLEANFKGVKRYDFVDNDSEPTDSQVGLDADGNGLEDELAGHGTHVAGIVDQVAPGAKIMPLRVLDSEGYGDVYTVARGISFALGHRIDVINLSLGTSEHSKLLQEMVEEAAKDDIVVAAAAGNSGVEEAHYPAAGRYGTVDVSLAHPTRDGLLAVTSVDEDLVRSDFATYGFWVDIVAPGEDIRSTFLGSKYANWSGTSMATPFVSGQAALIHTRNGSLTSEQIEIRIRDWADKSIYKLSDQRNLLYLLEYSGKLGKGHANICGSL